MNESVQSANCWIFVNGKPFHTWEFENYYWIKIGSLWKKKIPKLKLTKSFKSYSDDLLILTILKTDWNFIGSNMQFVFSTIPRDMLQSEGFMPLVSTYQAYHRVKFTKLPLLLHRANSGFLRLIWCAKIALNNVQSTVEKILDETFETSSEECLYVAANFK